MRREHVLATIVFLSILGSIGLCGNAYSEGPADAFLKLVQDKKKAVEEAQKRLEAAVKTGQEDNVTMAKRELGIAKVDMELALEQLQKHATEYQPFLKKEEKLSKDKCLMARPAFGDLGAYSEKLANWSVGTAVSTQVVKYTFGTKKASMNTGVGAGVAFRYYGDSPIGDSEEAKNLGFTEADLKKLNKYKKDDGQYKLPVYKVSPECRATTGDWGKERTAKVASSIVSITPTVYASKLDNQTDLSVQPALLIGFFDDIINIGPGFNLTGQDKGKVFLLLSLGYGFKF